MCNFCRFPETGGEFHDNLYDGLISICRKLLLKVFPCFDVNGYEELRSAAPVLYMGESASDIGLHVCSEVMCGGKKMCAVSNYNQYFSHIPVMDKFHLAING